MSQEFQRGSPEKYEKSFRHSMLKHKNSTPMKTRWHFKQWLGISSRAFEKGRLQGLAIFIVGVGLKPQVYTKSYT